MNLEPTQLTDKHGKVVDAAQAVCDVCHGNTFHIVVVNTHNHLICANPVCKESYCQGHGACEATPKPEETHCRKCDSHLDLNGQCEDETCPFSDCAQDKCPYCGSFMDADGCPKCGL